MLFVTGGEKTAWVLQAMSVQASVRLESKGEQSREGRL